MLVPSVTRPINSRHIAVLTSLRLGPLSLAFIGPAKWTLLPTEKTQDRIILHFGSTHLRWLYGVVMVVVVYDGGSK